MCPRVFVVIILLASIVSVYRAENQITIEMGDNGTTNLQSYLSDLHVAVSSVQYTANMSTRMLVELMDKLKRDEVKCECGEEEERTASRPKSMKSSFGRQDYRRTSPVAAHKLHTQPLKWNDARKLCNQEGAQLATIDSIDEAQILTKVLEEARGWSEEVNVTQSAFMGVHSHFEANDWVTVRGEPVPPSWSVVSNGSFHRCAILTVHSNLNAADCNQPRPYLCEIRLQP